MEMFGSPMDAMNRTGPEVNMYPGGASPVEGSVSGNGPGSSGMNIKTYTPSTESPIDCFCGTVENNYKQL